MEFSVHHSRKHMLICSVLGDASYGHLVKVASEGVLHNKIILPIKINKRLVGRYFETCKSFVLQNLTTHFSIHYWWFLPEYVIMMISKWSFSNSIISFTFERKSFPSPSWFISVGSHGFLAYSLGYNSLHNIIIYLATQIVSDLPIGSPIKLAPASFRHVLIFLWALPYFLAQKVVKSLSEGRWFLFFPQV